ncbi:MAG: hypothetical protein A7316_01655 [Candidatus Altiarchaeales archaeon WOR_SM1_86-2]|nr:MAG: hypothetical protein A7315_04360 [Candidatus Altiarchaeales archaeon WOR_SM1_79]ODS37518.1 MAG: hypothetical protein A7316_01655 [Candidatus Altiarchaeales archaeon WOR_SM1_86-2]
MKLKDVVDSYMRKVSGIEMHCDRCLKTERWGSSVVLMVVDAAFTSIGLNYFTAVVPKVEEFNNKFVSSGRIKNLNDLAAADTDELKGIWRNERSWRAAKDIASHLSSVKDNDKDALRVWAENADLKNRGKDPIGEINGVGINTFQYLRMMGGVDTVMPDKIVKRVINEILRKAGFEGVSNDIEFVEKAEEIALECGYKPIELCWMTWMVQPEGKMMRMKKYSQLLSKI